MPRQLSPPYAIFFRATFCRRDIFAIAAIILRCHYAVVSMLNRFCAAAAPLLLIHAACRRCTSLLFAADADALYADGLRHYFHDFSLAIADYSRLLMPLPLSPIRHLR